ncbi:MAG: phage tail fiber protein [Pseudodesulfovibrio sp.]
MTISSTESKKIYGGNSSTSVFPVPFMFSRNEDIEVVLTDIEGIESLLTISTDYQLSGAGESSGGTCTLSITPEAGQTVLFRRNPAMVQEVDYVENDAFPAATHEAALDKLTMICQALSERLDRTISFRVSSAVYGAELPEPAPGQLLSWNETGTNLANKVSTEVEGIGNVLLPLGIIDGGTGGSNANDALINLGFSPVGSAVATCIDTAEGLAALDAEPADPGILKADLPDVIQTVFSDEYQSHTGTDLATFAATRNKIEWTLTADSTFDELSPTHPVSLVFYINPAAFALSFASVYTFYGDAFNASASEVRVCVDINGTEKRVTIANAKAV